MITAKEAKDKADAFIPNSFMEKVNRAIKEHSCVGMHEVTIKFRLSEYPNLNYLRKTLKDNGFTYSITKSCVCRDPDPDPEYTLDISW